MDNIETQLIETWAINNRVNLYMLEAIAPEIFEHKLAGKGRSVGEQFEHIHNVRLMWLESGAPDLLSDLTKLNRDTTTDKPTIQAALEKSSAAVIALLQRGLAAGKIKGFKPHPVAFLGYLIAHESYHRAEIGIILTQAGYPLDKKIAFGMWEWGVR